MPPATISRIDVRDTSPAQDRGARLRTADKLLRLGKTQAAIQIYLEVVHEAPDDLETMRTLARLHLRIGDTAAASAGLLAIASAFLERQQPADAAAALREALELDPGNEAAQQRLFEAHLRGGQIPAAQELASTPAQWKQLATSVCFVDRSRELELLRQASRHNPGDLQIEASLARMFVADGNALEAVGYLRPEMAKDNPAALLAIAEIQLRSGRQEDALALVQECMQADAACIATIAALGTTATAAGDETSWRLVQLAVEAWDRQQNWTAAAMALDAFAKRVPTCIPALVRLLEVAIDGQMPDLASDAQTRLADAYLERRMAPDALAIIEDLVFREPDNPSHRDRFRRALDLSGEADPGAALERRLAGMRRTLL